MQIVSIITTTGDSYDISFGEDQISIEAYLLGSITGGTGTEKKSLIKGDNLLKLLALYSTATIEDLHKCFIEFNDLEIGKFLGATRLLEDITFLWSETDWSDDK